MQATTLKMASMTELNDSVLPLPVHVHVEQTWSCQYWAKLTKLFETSTICKQHNHDTSDLWLQHCFSAATTNDPSYMYCAIRIVISVQLRFKSH